MFIELKRYIAKPSYRDAWVELMENKIFPFILSKGMVALGSFIAVYDKDQFVWMCSFADEEEYDRLYQLVYESEWWERDIAPLANTMLEENRVKNLKLTSLMHEKITIFTDYHLKKNQLVEFRRFKIKTGRLSQWLMIANKYVIPFLNLRGAKVLDSFSLPAMKDTHLLMVSYPSEDEKLMVYNELYQTRFWTEQAQLLIEEEIPEVSLLRATDPRKFIEGFHFHR